MNAEAHTINFAGALSRFALRWRTGLLITGIVAAITLVLLIFVALGLFDYVAPFSDKVRPVMRTIFGSVCALIMVRALMPMLRLRARDAAQHADANTGVRRPVTSAFELAAKKSEDASPLGAYLMQRSLDDGARSLQQLPASQMMPWPGIRTQLLQFAAVLAVITGLFMANRDAVRTIAARLLHSGEDIPPWSPLVFEVTPKEPKAVYGSDAELEVKITGGAVSEGVVLLTRVDTDAEPAQAGAFAMGGGRFGQKLQRVVQPVQIAFAVGNARSKWMKVDVMRQPRFESVMIKIIPPAYTKLPAKEFAPGTGDLVAVAGSTVEAHITSNRPLSGGLITITPPRSISREKPDSIRQTAHGERAITLRWKVKSPALVRIDLTDITGAASAQPVELEQKLLPDNPPEVALNSPRNLVFATPESEVPVDLEAQDDFGIARVDLVRKLAGFRDRSRTLAEDAVETTFMSGEKMSMAALGVSPGQTLEFYGQAHDHNPTLMGIGSSPVGRVQIISHDEYASMVRARTTMQEFQEHFAALSQAVEAVRDALDKAAKGEPGAAAKAQAEMQKAEKLAEAMSKNFVAFEAEKPIAEEAKKIADLMKQSQQQLADAGAAGAQAAAKKLLDQMGGAAQAADKLKEEGEDLAQLGRVMEMASEFRAMHEQQKKLTKGLEELSNEIMAGNMRNAAKLDGLAGQQQEVLERWKAWDKELREAAAALPDKFEKFKQEATEFADKAEEAGIQRAMELAVAQAKKVQTSNTFVNSQFALAGMDSLFSGDNANNSMAKACNSKEPHFNVGPKELSESMSQTLSQMLAGMCQKRGTSSKPSPPGMADGMGMGGGGSSGVTMAGDPLMQAPVFGPGRMTFSGDSSLRGESKGSGKGNAAQTTVRPDAQTKIDTNATRTETRRQISLRDVPERYRDAVRRFYGEESVKETTTTKKP